MEEGIATHSSILAWRIPMDREAWWAIVHRVTKSWTDSWVGKICWRRNRLPTPVFLGFPCGSAGKESACNLRDLGLILGLGRSLGEGKGYPLLYSGLENSTDCIVHGVTESDTTERLSLSLFLLGLTGLITLQSKGLSGVSSSTRI